LLVSGIWEDKHPQRNKGTKIRGLSMAEEGEENKGVYRAQFWEAEIRVLIRGLSKGDHDAVKPGEGYHNVLGQLLGGVNMGQS
jgi:hypothetical protein